MNLTRKYSDRDALCPTANWIDLHVAHHLQTNLNAVEERRRSAYCLHNKLAEREALLSAGDQNALSHGFAPLRAAANIQIQTKVIVSDVRSRAKSPRNRIDEAFNLSENSICMCVCVRMFCVKLFSFPLRRFLALRCTRNKHVKHVTILRL